MGRCVIVAYTPKPAMAGRLRELVARHHRVLHGEGLVTDRPPWIMQAGDGTIVEVFEWRSVAAVAAAHENPTVQALWEEFAAVCEYRPLAGLAECAGLFAEFDALTL